MDAGTKRFKEYMNKGLSVHNAITKMRLEFVFTVGDALSIVNSVFGDDIVSKNANGIIDEIKKAFSSYDNLPNPNHELFDEIIVHRSDGSRSKAVVIDVIYHYKRKKWFYIVRIGGKKKSKQYFEDEVYLSDQESG